MSDKEKTFLVMLGLALIFIGLCFAADAHRADLDVRPTYQQQQSPYPDTGYSSASTQ